MPPPLAPVTGAVAISPHGSPGAGSRRRVPAPPRRTTARSAGRRTRWRRAAGLPAMHDTDREVLGTYVLTRIMRSTPGRAFTVFTSSSVM